jgi:magnesium-transporting ATPase (P-type)
VLFQVFNALSARSETASVFSRESLRNARLWGALGVVIALQAAAMHVDAVQTIFGTAEFTGWDWVLAVLVSSTLIWFDEVRKVWRRRANRG